MMEKDKITKRLIWICFIFAFLFFLLWHELDNTKYILLYVKVISKLSWCYAWASFGLGVRGFLTSKEKDKDEKLEKKDHDFLIRYITYAITLFFLSLFVFSILYLKGLTRGQSFYPLSIAIFSLMGFYAFMLENILIRLVK